ncbi:MAG: 7-cyano-7-deazaguanine reductase [Halieaceae bacterium]
MSDKGAGAGHDKGPLLGRQVSGSAHYDPSLLFPVARVRARSTLPAGQSSAYGADVWHAYELSWLNPVGMPEMHLGVLVVPADSPNLVESKSLKLYLNSLNGHCFRDRDEARQTIEGDLSLAAGAAVAFSVAAVEDSGFVGLDLAGDCLDALRVTVPSLPETNLLKGQAGDARLYTHLMRSLCPVTAQPDWATVVIETRGVSPSPEGLLAYLLAYRNHQEFHEQCVERIYADLMAALSPAFLSVQAMYTRRGGLDICPWRCSEDLPAPQGRLNRQ